MTSKFNLSEKIEETNYYDGEPSNVPNVDWLKIKDVREFIKLVKEKGYSHDKSFILIDTEDFDKLAGEKLNSQQKEMSETLNPSEQVAQVPADTSNSGEGK